MEAKSRKIAKNVFNKSNHGQLLVATEWFSQQYPTYTAVRVSIHPTRNMTKDANASDTKVLTLSKLNELVTNTRLLFFALSEAEMSQSELITYCEHQLEKHNLKPTNLVDYYLTSFALIDG